MSFIRNGVKEAFQAAKESKDIVGKGLCGIYFLDIVWSFIRYGARPRDYVMFGFYYQNHRRRNQCFTTFRFFRLTKKLDVLNECYKINSNKENELKLFRDFVKRDWMCVDTDTSNEDILQFIKKHGRVVVKPNGGVYGRGIFIVEGVDDMAISSILNRNFSERFILEEVVENMEEIAKFNRSTLNTVRIYTFIDNKGKVNVIGVMLRVGRRGAHVDNWGAGGIGYNFDVNTGVCDQPGRDKQMKQYIFHPDTDYQMVGFKLPDYDKLLDYVKKLAMVVPTARYVGWDIAITKKGYDFIEMNCPGGNDFLQAFGKYFNDYIEENW